MLDRFRFSLSSPALNPFEPIFSLLFQLVLPCFISFVVVLCLCFATGKLSLEKGGWLLCQLCLWNSVVLLKLFLWKRPNSQPRTEGLYGLSRLRHVRLGRYTAHWCAVVSAETQKPQDLVLCVKWSHLSSRDQNALGMLYVEHIHCRPETSFCVHSNWSCAWTLISLISPLCSLLFQARTPRSLQLWRD